MRIYMEGQDARSAYLCELLQAKGHEIIHDGPGDVIILSIPRSSIPFTEWAQWPRGQRIVCGLTSDAFDQQAKEKDWRLFRVLEDDVYTEENAVLSAEGAVYAVMRSWDFSLLGARCTVIGYGRIGKALTDKLRKLGAQVTVAARRLESRAAAGESSVPIEQIPSILPHTDILLNTVPSPIIENQWLNKLPKHALLIELASPPYGMDLAAAREMGLRAWGEWGIPGRYCPGSAARLLVDYLEREVLYE